MKPLFEPSQGSENAYLGWTDNQLQRRPPIASAEFPLGALRIINVADPSAGDGDVTVYTVPVALTGVMQNLSFDFVPDPGDTVTLRSVRLELFDDLNTIFAFMSNNGELYNFGTVKINYAQQQGGTDTVTTSLDGLTIYNEFRYTFTWRLLEAYYIKIIVDQVQAGDQLSNIIVYVEEF